MVSPAVASDRDYHGRSVGADTAWDYHGRSVGAAHRFGITIDVALEQHTAWDYHGRSVGAAHRFGITMDVALEQHTALGLPPT